MAMGIESFSVCNLLILHCLGKPLDSKSKHPFQIRGVTLLPESCGLWHNPA
jgi:hypothetical protein